MNTILAAIDFSIATIDILATVPAMAKALNAHVYLVHVTPPDPDFVGYGAGPQTVRDTIAQTFHEEHRQLQSFERDLQAEGVETTALLVQGSTTATLLGEAERLNAQMVIIGSHGHGAMYDLLVGSTAEGVLRKANCPVLMIPSVKDTQS